MVVLWVVVFCGVWGDFGVFCTVFMVLVAVCCVADGVVLLFVCLGVLADCGEGVGCLLVSLCFDVFVSRGGGGDCGVSTVNLFCFGVKVVWCIAVLSTLAYVCLQVVGVVVQVEVPGCVSVSFVRVLEREFLCVCFCGCFGEFVEAVAANVSFGSVWCRCVF